MKRALLILLGACLSLGTMYAQICQDASVELTAIVQADPPVITLTWRPNANATQHFVYRKLKHQAVWGSVIATLPGDATQYVDTEVEAGTEYEYRVLRQADAFSGYGYIASGIGVKAVHDRGIIMLAIDNTITDSLSFEISRLISDFEGDGWRVIRIDVPRNASALETKNLIKDVFVQNGNRTKALCLLGHVRVPYSGELNPDGHPDHLGAWPADTYYADMNGTWSDVTVNSTVANDERNRNTPGDGKFDQSLIPSDVELQVGRVDFFNMPSFTASEIQLLRNYLNKDHAYRHKEFTSVDRAIVDDNFGYFGGEAFASTGWKNFAPLVGFQNVTEADYFPSLADSIHQWSYGCGGGWYQGAGGVGSTTDFANSNTKSVFTLLFGSYHGDWDTPDNFLRAPLAQGLTLTNAWSGRPHWLLHHMGLGETIGYGTRLTMNNNNLYYASYGARFIHLALMGDPTLRNDVVAPVANVQAVVNGHTATLTWDVSVDETDGYEVYMKLPGGIEFNHMGHVDDPAFSPDQMCDAGTYVFMVRTVKLEVTPSGSYYNLSQGITTTLDHPGTPDVYTEASVELIGNEAHFSLDTTNAENFMWYFKDENNTTSTEPNPVFVYEPGQTYFAYLFSWNGCFTDTLGFFIDLTTGVTAITDDNAIQVSPNPSNGHFTLQLPGIPVGTTSLQVFASNGTLVKKQVISSAHTAIDMSEYPPGLYNLLIDSNGVLVRKTVVIQ